MWLTLSAQTCHHATSAVSELFLLQVISGSANDLLIYCQLARALLPKPASTVYTGILLQTLAKSALPARQWVAGQGEEELGEEEVGRGKGERVEPCLSVRMSVSAPPPPPHTPSF